MAKTTTKYGAKAELKQIKKRRRVTFSMEAAGASEVILMGDFNNWNPKSHPMKSDQSGIWSKTVMLPAGTYEYKFLIDGNWRLDPQNVQTCLNCFGSQNNVLNLTVS
jgi:1,4-alpha-glucan branching enzyme